MGWKGFVRSVRADMRRVDRESKREQRELERQEKLEQKMAELEQAAYDVDVYNNYVDRLISIHKDCSDSIDWKDIYNSQEPVEPKKESTNENDARSKFENFKPGLFNKLLKNTDKKLQGLENKIEEAKFQDESEYQERLQEYKNIHADWEESKKLAERVLNADKDAYLEVIKELNSFSEIAELGSTLNFQIGDTNIIEVSVNVHGEDVIPNETKSLLGSGKLSVKKMPAGKYYELYQVFICSCVLRIGSEIFSMLPVDLVIVNAIDKLLNSGTGHLEEQPILSVALSRSTIENMNLNQIDPSDSMKNFVHNMKFKKTSGFTEVEKIDPSTLNN